MVKQDKKAHKRFEVWLANLNPALGAEIKKMRPAVIVSSDEINKKYATVIVAPLTSTIRNYPSRVLTDFGNQQGQIVLDQIRAIDKGRLLRKLGTVDDEEAIAICQILETMFAY